MKKVYYFLRGRSQMFLFFLSRIHQSILTVYFVIDVLV